MDRTPSSSIKRRTVCTRRRQRWSGSARARSPAADTASLQEKNVAKQKVQKIVLAYSGGLDTSVILGWLREEYQAEGIAFCADVGQAEALAPGKGKASATAAPHA